MGLFERSGSECVGTLFTIGSDEGGNRPFQGTRPGSEYRCGPETAHERLEHVIAPIGNHDQLRDITSPIPE
jgi:hypothetical protein